jgi:hypothetical protein
VTSDEIGWVRLIDGKAEKVPSGEGI